MLSVIVLTNNTATPPDELHFVFSDKNSKAYSYTDYYENHPAFYFELYFVYVLRVTYELHCHHTHLGSKCIYSERQRSGAKAFLALWRWRVEGGGGWVEYSLIYFIPYGFLTAFDL